MLWSWQCLTTTPNHSKGDNCRFRQTRKRLSPRLATVTDSTNLLCKQRITMDQRSSAQLPPLTVMTSMPNTCRNTT